MNRRSNYKIKRCVFDYLLFWEKDGPVKRWDKKGLQCEINSWISGRTIKLNTMRISRISQRFKKKTIEKIIIHFPYIIVFIFVVTLPINNYIFFTRIFLRSPWLQTRGILLDLSQLKWSWLISVEIDSLWPLFIFLLNLLTKISYVVAPGCSTFFSPQWRIQPSQLTHGHL